MTRQPQILRVDAERMKTFIVRVPSGGGGEVLSSGNFSNKYQKLEEEGEIRFPAPRLLFKQH